MCIILKTSIISRTSYPLQKPGIAFMCQLHSYLVPCDYVYTIRVQYWLTWLNYSLSLLWCVSMYELLYYCCILYVIWCSMLYPLLFVFYCYSQTSNEFASIYNGYGNLRHKKYAMTFEDNAPYYKAPTGAQYSDLPRSMDWRVKNVTTPVKNQVRL